MRMGMGNEIGVGGGNEMGLEEGMRRKAGYELNVL